MLTEENNAYCVAVNLRLVRLDKYAMKTVPANPMVKLSALIVIVNMPMFGPTKARIAKKRLVLAIRIVATILIASTNLFFAILALVGPNIGMLTITISADNFTMGFAGTVFIAYLSSLTNLKFTATQYALFSSVSTFFGKFLAGFSGNIQEISGWLGFFIYAGILGLPAIFLSFFAAKQYDKIKHEE